MVESSNVGRKGHNRNPVIREDSHYAGYSQALRNETPADYLVLSAPPLFNTCKWLNTIAVALQAHDRTAQITANDICRHARLQRGATSHLQHAVF